jgi:hypothetical protein
LEINRRKHSTQAIFVTALGSSGAAGKRKLRLETNFHRRINTIAAATSFTAKFPLAPSGKSPPHFRASRPDERGATRSSRALVRDAMAAMGRSGLLVRRRTMHCGR